MFDTRKIDAIVAREGINRDILPHEVREIIETAQSEGLFSSAVSAWQPDSWNLVLALDLSDEVRVVSKEIGVREFISQDADSARESVRFLLAHVESILTEVRDAALGGRQADWRHTKVLGNG